MSAGNLDELERRVEIPRYLRTQLDEFIAAIVGRAFEAGRKQGERDAMRRIVKAAGAIARDTGTFEPGLSTTPASILQIQRAVAAAFEINPLEMVSQRRSRDIALPRQVAMFLSKELTPHSCPMIGRHFGNRDHTTVIHAIRKVRALAAQDPYFGKRVASLRKALGGPSDLEAE